MKKLAGMTFVEILIALVIVMIILSSMFVGINFAEKYARHCANRTSGINIAQAGMEELIDVSYSELDDYDGVEETVFLFQDEDTIIDVTRAITVIKFAQYKTVNVTATWDWQGFTYVEELNTIRGDY